MPTRAELRASGALFTVMPDRLGIPPKPDRSDNNTVVPKNMIVFPDAKMGRAHSGHAVIELTEDGTWEGFPRFAEAFTNQIGATKIDGVDGPDVRFWDIQLDGIRLNLGYDDFPNGLSLMSYSAEGDQLLQRVFDDLTQIAEINKAQQATAPNRSEAPILSSTSSARGSEG